MAHGDPTSHFESERRRIAVLAAILLALVSAYAVLLGLPTQGSARGTGAGYDALLMAFILAGISCAGIAAAARPSQCIELLPSRKQSEIPRGPPPDSEDEPSFRLVAHHCSCGRFDDHTLRVGDRTVCAGCLGMAAGGACGIGLAVALGAGLLFLEGTAAFAAALLGAAACAAGLAELYRRSPPEWHAAANFSFVAGAALLGALLSSRGIAAGAFGLLAALALVGLRIEMSRWRHLSVYAGCPWQGTCHGASALAAARGPTRR